MKQSVSSTIGVFIGYLIVLALLVAYFLFLKLAWVNVFNIWDIALTPNQSTALAFLTVVLNSNIKRRGVE